MMTLEDARVKPKLLSVQKNDHCKPENPVRLSVIPQEKGKNWDLFNSSTLMNCTRRNSKIYPMHRCSASSDNFDDVWAINSIRTISFTPTVTLSSEDRCRRSLGGNFSDVCPKELHKPLCFADKNVTEYHDHSGSKKNHSYTYGTSHCKWMGLTPSELRGCSRARLELPCSCHSDSGNDINGNCPYSWQQARWDITATVTPPRVPHACLECCGTNFT